MAEFGNLIGSDEDSNEDIDHIPKTPGPAIISDREESDDEREEEDVKNRANDSESDSDSSDSESQSSDNRNESQNDSEVERSDNENDNRLAIDANDVQSSDEDIDKSDNEEKAVNESHDNESDDEIVNRRVANKRKFSSRDDSSSDDMNDSKSEGIDKKQKLETSDNEDNDEDDDNEEEVDRKNAKAKDIFGDLSSEDEDEDNERQRVDSINEDEDKRSEKDSSVDENVENEQRYDENSNEGMANNNEAVGEQPFIEEEEPQEEPVPETRIEVEIPRIVADLGKEIHFVKLPNFLSIDTHPYDPQWYDDEIDEDENLDEEGRARLKLKVENTIRWRNVYDTETGDVKKESNARVVRWSDGSLSLHLGDEIFDIHKLQLMPGDNNHLFIRQGTGLQGQTVFSTKLTFRPFSTESFTHRKLTLSLADRSQKTQKIRVLPNVGKDPEAHRSEMIKKEEDRLKASIRRENKMRRVRERSLIRGPTASYLEPDGEEDDEEEGISISKIKNQYKKGNLYTKYLDEGEVSGDETKPDKDDDDSDLDIFDKKTDGKKRTAQIVESDDE